MKQKDVEFIKEKFQIDITNYNKIEQKNILSIIENYISEKKEKYENANDTSSPQYFFNKIRDELRKDGGWADTDRDIKGNTVKSRVTEDFVKNLADKEEPIETEDVLRQSI